ncbi:TonB-dependent receptor [Sphingomonas paucimobilis]|nr:TonB-dependent receptor [Sphingomonas paucimobilis]
MTTRSIRMMAALLAGAAAATMPVVAHAQDDRVYQFDLPAQNLGDALRSVAARAGWELYASADDINGIAAPRLEGTLTARQAIERLLAGTNLTARFTKGGVIIRGRSQAEEAVTDDEGNAEIVVTGTHIRGAIPTAPVRTFTREKIEEQGFRDLGDLARSIPQNFNGGQNPGVAGGGNQGVGNENSSSSSALNLRGLGPAATLTLLNGHRFAYDTIGQGVDISQIPLSAIDRVEIVTDGSSALYGSDAVGGVANIILRRDYDGLLAGARLGGSTDGGNTQQQYDLLGGARWSSGGALLAASFSNITAIDARQRDYTANLDGSSTLVPWQRQYSLLAAGHQKLGETLSLELDANFNRRISERAAPSLATADVRTNGLLARPTVTSATFNAALRWDVGNSWTLAATGTYGFSNNRIFSRRFSGGVETLRTFLNYDNEVAVAELNAEGVLFDLPGGQARLALGGGYRHTGLDVLIRQGSGTSAAVTTDIRSGRDVYYGFGELSLPIVGEANAAALLHRLQLNLAARYENYPGNSRLVTPKIGAVYEPHSAITIRANWGRSFKTQTLYQQYQARQGVLLPAFVFQSSPTSLPVLILAGGNTDLKPEKAETWSAGLSIRPLSGLELEGTYFRLRYRDRVVSPLTSLVDIFTNPIYRDFVALSPSQTEVAAAVASLPQGLSNSTGTPFDPAAVGALVDGSLQNAARQNLQGVDIVARYRVELSGGNSVQFDASASYLDSDQQLSPGNPFLRLAGTIFNPPHWRGRLGGTWKQDNVTLSANLNYIGGTSDTRFTPAEHVGSFTSLDLVGIIRSKASAGAFAGLDLTASVLNLFNTKPATIRNPIATDPPYDSTNYPVAGRVISLAISKAF